MSKAAGSPLVGIVMGSASDLPIMRCAGDILDHFGVRYEFGIKSPPRTPESAVSYAKKAFSRGLRVIIAGAGGSGHLPGLVASRTRLPVLGVIIENPPDPANATLISMTRMPKGVPISVMGTGETGAVNAALQAVRILALYDETLDQAYDAYVATMAREVEAQNMLLTNEGVDALLKR